MNEKGFALVTGASSGIGLAIARDLAGRDYPVLLVSNEEEKIAKVSREIQSEFRVNAISLYMDLAQRDAAQKLYEYCETNDIPVEILVNNAGIFFFRDVTKTESALIEKVINLHVLTPTLLARLFADRMMKENRKGYILNIASIAAWMMMPGITLYSATKSYLHCFSRALRHETYNHGIGITTVCPGAVATGLYGLAPRYMKLGLFFRIIIKPEQLALKAINKMFKKKCEYIPGGLLNRFFIFIVKSLPEWLVRRLKKKIDSHFQ